MSATDRRIRDLDATTELDVNTILYGVLNSNTPNGEDVRIPATMLGAGSGVGIFQVAKDITERTLQGDDVTFDPDTITAENTTVTLTESNTEINLEAGTWIIQGHIPQYTNNFDVFQFSIDGTLVGTAGTGDSNANSVASFPTVASVIHKSDTPFTITLNGTSITAGASSNDTNDTFLVTGMLVSKAVTIGGQGPDGNIGATGAQGATGGRGPDGNQGADGDKGPDGDRGAKGLTGDKGPDGDQGEQGPQGPVGSEGEIGVLSFKTVRRTAVNFSTTDRTLTLPLEDQVGNLDWTVENNTVTVPTGRKVFVDAETGNLDNEVDLEILSGTTVISVREDTQGTNEQPYKTSAIVDTTTGGEQVISFRLNFDGAGTQNEPIQTLYAKFTDLSISAIGGGGGGGTGTDGADGDDAWTPELGVVARGDDRVLQVNDWFGGTLPKPATGDYIGPNGFESDIADALNIRGDDGDDGAPGRNGTNGTNGTNGDPGTNGTNGYSPQFAVVADGERRVLQVTGWTGGTGTPPSSTNVFLGSTGFVNSATLAIDIRGAAGSGGGGGGTGTDGTNGYSPQFAVATDGERRVLQVSGWTGGTGTAPATGQYVGATGLVADIGDGIDIRGAAGADGGDTDPVSNDQEFATRENTSFESVPNSVNLYDGNASNSVTLFADPDGSSQSAIRIHFARHTGRLAINFAPSVRPVDGTTQPVNGVNGNIRVRTFLNGTMRDDILDMAYDFSTGTALTDIDMAIAGEIDQVEIMSEITRFNASPANTFGIRLHTVSFIATRTETLNQFFADYLDTANQVQKNTGDIAENVEDISEDRVRLDALEAGGSDGMDGTNGYSPQFAVVTDGERRVLQVIGWTGGTGTPPSSTNVFLGSTGFVNTAGAAIDIRGATGAAGMDGTGGGSGGGGGFGGVASFGLTDTASTASARWDPTSLVGTLTPTFTSGNPNTFSLPAGDYFLVGYVKQGGNDRTLYHWTVDGTNVGQPGTAAGGSQDDITGNVMTAYITSTGSEAISASNVTFSNITAIVYSVGGESGGGADPVSNMQEFITEDNTSYQNVVNRGNLFVDGSFAIMSPANRNRISTITSHFDRHSGGDLTVNFGPLIRPQDGDGLNLPGYSGDLTVRTFLDGTQVQEVKNQGIVFSVNTAPLDVDVTLMDVDIDQVEVKLEITTDPAFAENEYGAQIDTLSLIASRTETLNEFYAEYLETANQAQRNTADIATNRADIDTNTATIATLGAPGATNERYIWYKEFSTDEEMASVDYNIPASATNPVFPIFQAGGTVESDNTNGDITVIVADSAFTANFTGHMDIAGKLWFRVTGPNNTGGGRVKLFGTLQRRVSGSTTWTDTIFRSTSQYLRGDTGSVDQHGYIVLDERFIPVTNGDDYRITVHGLSGATLSVVRISAQETTRIVIQRDD